MNKDEIIAMATEAGLNSYRIAPGEALAVWERIARAGVEHRRAVHEALQQERAEFEARFNHLDLTQEPDAWGVPRYKHGAISLAWEAWQTARRAQAVLVPQWDGKINPADFNVEIFRRSGKNGWIAKPDNYCVRITHVHTGLFEEGVSERSIHTNKAEAWERLSARLEAIATAHPAEGVPSQTVPVGYVALAALTSRTHADDYAKCFATETALLENYPAAKVIAVFDHAASQPAAQGMNAPNEWEEIRTLPSCDDLIWLYCQDTNTIDGPISPEPNLEQYGWTHWAYANAPSTAWIDAAQAKKE